MAKKLKFNPPFKGPPVEVVDTKEQEEMPEKIAHSEALYDVLSEVFDMSTTSVSIALMRMKLASWESFKKEVEERAQEIKG